MSLHLASLFQNHAVLQRDQMIPVWGWADPSTQVRITLAGNQAICMSNARGDFLARLPSLPAGGPHTLKVEIVATGEQLVLTDLLVGEVWLASGQSNMHMTLSQCGSDTAEAIATADLPQVRCFTVTKRAALGSQQNVEGSWILSTPASVSECSAVAFSFARRLHRELGIPVGLISSSWGGTFIQAWISRSTLAHNPEIQKWLAEYETATWTPARWKDVGEDPRLKIYPPDPGITQAWHLPACDDTGWSKMKVPSTWQFAGHKHSGVFWFRLSVEIPASWAGRNLSLQLGGIDKQDITFANGVEIGRTGKGFEDQQWNFPRDYTVPASAVTGRTLTIAVRAYSFVFDGGMNGPASVMKVHPVGQPDTAIPLSGEWRYRCEHDLGLVVLPAAVMGHDQPNSPHILFDNMIQPLVPYALRGAIWYQGESNSGAPALYASLMRDLINDWRDQWGQPDLAFHLVQLPGYMTPQTHQPASNWARLRESQTAALDLPHTGMAVTIDLGEAGDIHPKNKVPVGERLAQSALALTYGRPVVPYGPLADKFTVIGNTLRCDFRHSGAGLTTINGAVPSHFFVAGEDRIFHPADARIAGSAVVVTSPAVAKPVAVRYAWADNPEGCNLANADGLPASPFRSDRW